MNTLNELIQDYQKPIIDLQGGTCDELYVFLNYRKYEIIKKKFKL